MRNVIETGLPSPRQPFSWATRANGLIFTTHGPVLPDGNILQGSIEDQARLTLENLRQALASAGATLDDVVQVQIFLIDGADMAPVDQVYRSFFAAPFPTRASLIVAGLVAPGMRIELSAIAAPNTDRAR